MKPLLNSILIIILSSISFLAMSDTDEIDNVVDDLTLSILEYDTNTFASYLDMHAYANRILSYTDYDTQTKSSYKDILISKKQQLIKNLYLNTFSNGNVDIQFKRSFIRDNNIAIQFRVIGSDQSVTFLDFILEKDKKNNLKIIDFFSADSGEYLSKTAGQAIMLAVPKRNYLQKILNISSIDESTVKHLSKVTSNFREAKYQQAYTEFKKLPLAIRTYPAFARLGSQIAINLNDEQYFEYLSFINEHFSDDPSFSFTLVDYLYMKEDFLGAIKSLLVLNEEVKGDAYILYLIANTYGMIQDSENQYKYANASLELEPQSFYSNYAMLDFYIMSGQFERAIQNIIEFNKQFDNYFVAEDFHEEQTYETFVNSQNFKSHFGIE